MFFLLLPASIYFLDFPLVLLVDRPGLVVIVLDDVFLGLFLVLNDLVAAVLVFVQGAQSALHNCRLIVLAHLDHLVVLLAFLLFNTFLDFSHLAFVPFPDRLILGPDLVDHAFSLFLVDAQLKD